MNVQRILPVPMCFSLADVANDERNRWATTHSSNCLNDIVSEQAFVIPGLPHTPCVTLMLLVCGKEACENSPYRSGWAMRPLKQHESTPVLLILSSLKSIAKPLERR